MDSLQRVAAVFIAVVAIAWGMAVISIAETAEPPSQHVPEATAPGSSTQPLSSQLDRSGGVIKPPADLDPGLTKTPPDDGRTPVVKPPGSGGDDSGVKPK